MKNNIETGLKRLAYLIGIFSASIGFIVLISENYFLLSKIPLQNYLLTIFISGILGYIIFRIIIWVIKGFSITNENDKIQYNKDNKNKI